MDTLYLQRFTRMVRSPRSCQLWRVLDRDWEHFLKVDRGDVYIPEEVHKARKGTIIYDTIERSRIPNRWLECSNDDMEFLRQGVTIDDIPNNLNHSLWLTKDWDWIEIREEPFTDEYWEDDYIRRTNHQNGHHAIRDLLVFTDGSVEERTGGFGAFVVPETVYSTLLRMQPKDEDDIARLNRHIKRRHEPESIIDCVHNTYEEPLSERCSIDFCEAHAIHHALKDIYLQIERVTQEWWKANEQEGAVNPVLNDQGMTHIRVVSDSKTVIKWISGEYTVRHPNMRRLVREIRWNADLFKKYYNVTVLFQWTKSHTGKTTGNDMADRYAMFGRLKVEETKAGERTSAKPEDWKWYGMRAVLNRCRTKNAKTDMEVNYMYKMEATRYAKPWQKESERAQQEAIERVHESGKMAGLDEEDWPDHWKTGIKWNDRFKKELKHMSRDVIRIISGLRTGKNHLNQYLHKRLKVIDSAQCECGDTEQDIYHLLKDCDYHGIAQRRDTMQTRVRKIYLDHWQTQTLIHDKTLKWNPRTMDYEDPNTYLFPPQDIPIERRTWIMTSIANFYRWIRSYNERQRRKRGEEEREVESSRSGIG